MIVNVDLQRATCTCVPENLTAFQWNPSPHNRLPGSVGMDGAPVLTESTPAPPRSGSGPGGSRLKPILRRRFRLSSLIIRTGSPHRGSAGTTLVRIPGTTLRMFDPFRGRGAAGKRESVPRVVGSFRRVVSCCTCGLPPNSNHPSPIYPPAPGQHLRQALPPSC